MIELYQEAVLARDLPAQSLCRGDIVMVVEKLTAPSGLKGCCVEVLNAMGQAIRVEVVAESDLEALRADELLCVRQPATRAKAA